MLRHVLSLLLVTSCAAAQGGAGPLAGTPQNVLLPGAANLEPLGQEPVISPDGSFVAVTASDPAADVALVSVDERGLAAGVQTVAFPSGNGVHPTNRALVASRRGRFLCVFGTDSALGDLVFLTRSASGNWFAQNVLFPGGNDVPAVGTRPVISRDGAFIVCRATSADLVIVPVLTATSGTLFAGTPFAVSFPGANNILQAPVTPVVAPNGRSLAVPGTSASGDLVVVRVGRPVSPSNVSTTNLDFPAGNVVVAPTVPVTASPRSNWYAVHGLAQVGDLVVVPVAPDGTPGTPVNVLWPAGNNTADLQGPPAVSGDGRLIGTNGLLSVGDLVLLPLGAGGSPGTPLNVDFPGPNFVANLQLPPAVSGDAALVVQRGSPTIGDLVAVQVGFTSSTTITATATNVLYPAGNNLPSSQAGVALAPDRSFCVTTGIGTVGDLVITPFFEDGSPATPENVVYPAGNAVGGLGVTPRISPGGNLVLTSGSATIGDLVLTLVAPDPGTCLMRSVTSANLLYPASNNVPPAAAPPGFAPTGQFMVSAGSAVIGDLVVARVRVPQAYPLAPADLGRTLPLRFASPGDAGGFFVAAASTGRCPGLPLPDGRTVPLRLDPLLVESLVPSSPFFAGFSGLLDGSGVAEGEVLLPDDPALKGLSFYLGFAVADPMDPTGVGTIARTRALRLR